MKSEEVKVKETLEMPIVEQLGNEEDADELEKEFMDNQHLNNLMRVHPISVEKDEYTIFILNTPITRKTYTHKDTIRELDRRIQVLRIIR